jgi:peptidoglycan/xylan/chitin deacetylase (PgdA/CDA1 family)
VELAQRPRPGKLVVLTYHRVRDATGFEAQMRFLASRHVVVSARQVLEARHGRITLPARAVMITFDDAYREFAEVACPILKRHGLPVTLFVPTGYPGRPDRVFWWDRLVQIFQGPAPMEAIETAIGRLPVGRPADRRATFRRLREHYRGTAVETATQEVEALARELRAPSLSSSVLDWPELRRLAQEGVTLASHTRTHPPMHLLEVPTARAEVLDSMEDLRREVGEVLPLFAYPGGRYSPRVVQAVREAGIELAFTTVRGTNDLELEDPLLLRRNNLGWSADASILRARLIQALPLLNRMRPMPEDR